MSLLSLPDLDHVGVSDPSCIINAPRASSTQQALEGSSAPSSWAGTAEGKWKLLPEEQPAAVTGREPGRGFLQETRWGKVTCPEVPGDLSGHPPSLSLPTQGWIHQPSPCGRQQEGKLL